MKPVFIQYAKCGTCQKALKWLKVNQIDVEVRDIITHKPTFEELDRWTSKSELPINKFFNTSGVLYRELNVKDTIKTASREELLRLLASDGKLVKRPVLIYNNSVLIGFTEKDWEALLICSV